MLLLTVVPTVVYLGNKIEFEDAWKLPVWINTAIKLILCAAGTLLRAEFVSFPPPRGVTVTTAHLRKSLQSLRSPPSSRTNPVLCCVSSHPRVFHSTHSPRHRHLCTNMRMCPTKTSVLLMREDFCMSGCAGLWGPAVFWKATTKLDIVAKLSCFCQQSYHKCHQKRTRI